MRPFLLLCALALPALAGAQPGAALINPGFDTAGPDGVPAGWSKYVRYFGHATVAVDAAVKHGGAGAARIELAAKSRCALSQMVASSAEGPQTLTCQVRGQEAAAVPVQVQVNWFRIVEWPLRLEMLRAEAPSAAVYAGPDWQAVATVATRPAEATLAQVAVIAGAADSPAGTVWVDDLTFAPGARPWPLLTNGSFAVAGAEGVPAGWGRGGEGGGFAVVVDTQVFHSAPGAARLTGLPGHGDRVCLSQMTPVFTTPRRLRISFWYKGTGKADGIIDVLPPPGVKAKEGGVYYDRLNFNPPLPQTDWQHFVIEQDTTAEARAAGTMRLQPLLYQKGDGDLWYDDVQVELLD